MLIYISKDLLKSQKTVWYTTFNISCLPPLPRRKSRNGKNSGNCLLAEFNIPRDVYTPYDEKHDARGKGTAP